MRYKKILLDADDTIWNFGAGNRNAVGQLMEELGLASPTIFDEYQAINHACWQALERGEMTQEILHVERFRRFLAMKNRTDDPEKVVERFAYLLGQQVIPIPGAAEALEEIAKKLPIVLLTNGITVIQKSRLAIASESKYFSKVVISQEVGVAKPDPRIFEIALEGCDPRNALMIGDGLNSDVRGANNAGVDVCWYNPGRKALPEDMRAAYIIHDIRDCAKIALQ